MPDLVLLRHGQSLWNLENRFTGWTDVDLSEKGRDEARRSGELIKGAGLELSHAYASVLKRAIRTLWISLDVMDRMWLPQSLSWRLNERHYGALQGLNKAETAQKHGEEQVHIWRRSFDVPPPLLEPLDPRHPRLDPRYQDVPRDELPAGESLAGTLLRLTPYWQTVLKPALLDGRGLLIAAHGNSLRALVKLLMHVPDADIPHLEIPTGNPLHLSLDADLQVTSAAYLDAKRAGPLP